MRFLEFLMTAALVAVVAGDAVTDLQNEGQPQIYAYLAQSNTSTCTNETMRVRREYGDITVAERMAYNTAVLCLLKLPSKLSPTLFPGAHSRYDDFVVVHMNQTLSIHGTGNFLSWHRFFVWNWENALRDECGYTGTVPYWDYGRWAQDPLSSPLFDGSDSSLGGNGAAVNRTGANGFSPVPEGVGGGCISTGPYKNMTVYLGPMSPVADPPPPKNPQANGYGNNPRCIRRDITNYLSSRYGTTAAIVASIKNFDNVLTFQNFMQGGEGVHPVGHYTVSGDPGGDFYISPNEPSFWAHHSMIDRVWTIWQSLNYSSRVTQMEGGTSMFGGGKAQQLTDLVYQGVVAKETYMIKDLLSTVDGPFCYRYE